MDRSILDFYPISGLLSAWLHFIVIFVLVMSQLETNNLPECCNFWVETEMIHGRITMKGKR